MAASADRDEIISLAVAYCWALDTRDYDALRSVFTPDATAQLGRSAQNGVDEIIERVSTSLSRWELSQHTVSTHEISIDDDDHARARCYLYAQHVRPEGEDPRFFTLGGRYEDRLVRTRDGWRIAHRDLVTMWTDGA